jgi:hypothetical protein
MHTIWCLSREPLVLICEVFAILRSKLPIIKHLHIFFVPTHWLFARFLIHLFIVYLCVAWIPLRPSWSWSWSITSSCKLLSQNCICVSHSELHWNVDDGCLRFGWDAIGGPEEFPMHQGKLLRFGILRLRLQRH